jgi:arylsulfatase
VSLAIGLGVFGCAPPEPPAHLVLISVDTLRADRLGVYGNPLDLTPAIDRLAEGCTRFDAAYAAAPVTLPSTAALMTSRHPEELGITGNHTRLRLEAVTLAEWLHEAGWRTGAVVGAYVLRPAAGIHQGFDEFDAHFPQKEAVRKAPERIASTTTVAALEMLDRFTEAPQKPLFLWVHYQDPHGPYTPPEPVRAADLEWEREEPDGRKKLSRSRTWAGRGTIPIYQYIAPQREAAWYRAAYDGEVRFMDREVGRLLEGLEAAGVRDRALVVFTADHGENLGEHNYWFSHGELLSEPSLRIPLLVCVPGQSSHARTDTVSILDVTPTVLARLGLPSLAGARGRDLSANTNPAAKPAAIFSTTSEASRRPSAGLVAGKYKYVRASEAPNRSEALYELPDDTTDRAASLPDVLEDVRARFDRWYGELSPSEPQQQQLSPEEREALEALGYGE